MFGKLGHEMPSLKFFKQHFGKKLLIVDSLKQEGKQKPAMDTIHIKSFPNIAIKKYSTSSKAGILR